MTEKGSISQQKTGKRGKRLKSSDWECEKNDGGDGGMRSGIRTQPTGDSEGVEESFKSMSVTATFIAALK